MAETTEATQTQTDATTSEATAASLLTSTETVATDQQQSEPVKPPEGEAAKPTETKEETKPEGAPEKYEFKAPEGKEYDSAVLDSFSAAAKQANLTQDAAQKLLESMAPALVERQAAQVKAVQDGWLESSRADKEFGGEKLAENLAVAKSAIDTFASPELKALLNSTGLGNNPEVIRFAYKIGKAMSEDKVVTGQAAASGQRDLVKSLYPNTPSKE